MNKVNSTGKFFDDVSGFYDSMINFSSSLDNRIKLLGKFITPEMKTAADLGCGTGIDSIALTKLGIKVTGFDISGGMIQKAKENAQHYGCNIDFHQKGIEEIGTQFIGLFDIAISFGNTIANLDEKKLKKAVGNIYKILRPGGRFVLQILNFYRIRKNDERILKISLDSSKCVVRFFDILKNNFNLNVLSFNLQRPDEFNLVKTAIYPYDFSQMKSVLKSTGFKDIKKFGNLKLDKFDKTTSSDLIVICHK